MINEGIELIENIVREKGINNIDDYGKSRGKLDENINKTIRMVKNNNY